MNLKYAKFSISPIILYKCEVSGDVFETCALKRQQANKPNLKKKLSLHTAIRPFGHFRQVDVRIYFGSGNDLNYVNLIQNNL